RPCYSGVSHTHSRAIDRPLSPLATRSQATRRCRSVNLGSYAPHACVQQLGRHWHASRSVDAVLRQGAQERDVPSADGCGEVQMWLDPGQCCPWRRLRSHNASRIARGRRALRSIPTTITSRTTALTLVKSCIGHCWDKSLSSLRTGAAIGL